MKRILACSLLLAGLVLLASGAAAQQPSVTPDAALQKLKDGNAHFAADKLAAKDVGTKRRAELTKGQAPYAVILSCADSRVPPELLFDQGLGELFTVRVAGNITDPAILGSIEYAVEHLKSPLVVVLGHESCGAVKAVLSGEEAHGNIAKLLKDVQVGKDLPKDKAAAVDAGIKNNALYHAGQLTQQSKILKDFATAGRIKIVTGVYSLSTGKVDWVDAPKK